MVSIPFQELKANGDGSFDGGVKRKTESRMGEADRNPGKHFQHKQAKAGRDSGLGSFQGNMFLVNKESCTKDRLSSTISHLLKEPLHSRARCSGLEVELALEGFGQCCDSAASTTKQTPGMVMSLS